MWSQSLNAVKSKIILRILSCHCFYFYLKNVSRIPLPRQVKRCFQNVVPCAIALFFRPPARPNPTSLHSLTDSLVSRLVCGVHPSFFFCRKREETAVTTRPEKMRSAKVGVARQLETKKPQTGRKISTSSRGTIHSQQSQPEDIQMKYTRFVRFFGLDINLQSYLDHKILAY